MSALASDRLIAVGVGSSLWLNMVMGDILHAQQAATSTMQQANNAYADLSGGL